MKTAGWILVLGGVAAAACATSGKDAGTAAPPTSGDTAVAAAPGATAATSGEEKALRQRVDQWWEAREYRDYRTMYSLYESPMRRRLTLEDYRAQAIPRDRLDLSAHEVKTVTFKNPDRATVRIGYRVRLPQLPEAITSLMDEDWVREKGRWYKVYFIPEPLQPPPGMFGSGATPGQPGPPAPTQAGPLPPLAVPPPPGQPQPSPSPSPSPSPR